jgi:hypothetical protein
MPAPTKSFHIAGLEPMLEASKLQERSLAQIRFNRPLRLVNLAESGALMRIGVDARLFTARHTVSQR